MTWILLRGLTREARHWGAFTSLLAERNGEEVLRLDLPGSGEFAAAPSPASVAGIVDFLRAQLQAKKLQGPHKLLALSLGGMVATGWAQRYPDEVKRLVLINTSMRPYSSVTQRLRPANWPQLAMLAARWPDADYAEGVIHDLTCNATATHEADIAAWLQIRKSAPVTPGNAARQLLAAARFACAEATPRCQTLVLSSAGDRLVNPVCSTRLAAGWQAKHLQHPWAGHDLPHDDGEWICTQLRDWMASSSVS
ncbi:MAG: alpha/beta hydrolase [Pseudomonadota bacterium]